MPLVLLMLVVLVTPPPATAHHGRDFLLNRSTLVTDKGMWTAHATVTFSRDHGKDVTEVEPGVTLFPGKGLGLDLHAHFSREQVFESESFGFEVQRFLFNDKADFLFDGIAEYEIGLHDHPDEWSLTLVAQHLLTDAVLNLKYARERSAGQSAPKSRARKFHGVEEAAAGGNRALALSLGYPYALRNGALLIEGEAFLDGPDAHAVSLAFRTKDTHFEPLFLIGLKVGLGDDAADWTAQASYVVPMFR